MLGETTLDVITDMVILTRLSRIADGLTIGDY